MFFVYTLNDNSNTCISTCTFVISNIAAVLTLSERTCICKRNIPLNLYLLALHPGFPTVPEARSASPMFHQHVQQPIIPRPRIYTSHIQAIYRLMLPWTEWNGGKIFSRLLPKSLSCFSPRLIHNA